MDNVRDRRIGHGEIVCVEKEWNSRGYYDSGKRCFGRRE
jgi:hypothetical protein